MKNFALIGAAGYIAPRHLKAIKETQNNLVAALDPCDNVGILDSYFPNTDFFTEFERYDRHIEKLTENKSFCLVFNSILLSVSIFQGFKTNGFSHIASAPTLKECLI